MNVNELTQEGLDQLLNISKSYLLIYARENTHDIYKRAAVKMAAKEFDKITGTNLKLMIDEMK